MYQINTLQKCRREANGRNTDGCPKMLHTLLSFKEKNTLPEEKTINKTKEDKSKNKIKYTAQKDHIHTQLHLS